MKVCMEPGCWNPTPNTRCPEHERAWQAARNARRGAARKPSAPYRKMSLIGLVCACCGTDQDLTRHHVLPLSHVDPAPLPAGAAGYRIVAMCRRCNGSIADRVMDTHTCPMHGGQVRRG